MEFNHFKMERTLDEGDLCVLDGYGNRIWEVVGFTLQKSQMNGIITEAIIYDLSCIKTVEWNIGMQSETTLVCKAAYAYEYVKELNDQGLPPLYSPEEEKPIRKKKKGVATMTNRPVDKEAKIPYIYPDTIDGLLQKLSDLNCVGEELGEIDEQLQSKIDDTKVELTRKKQELEY